MPTTLDSRPLTTAVLPGFLAYLSAVVGGGAPLGGCTGCVDIGGMERRGGEDIVVGFWH